MPVSAHKINKGLEFARQCIGTPFHHQGRIPGVGLDCGGLLAVVGHAAGLPVEDISNYPHIPADSSFRALIERQTNKIQFNDLQLGDLVMFKFDKEAQHIGIVSSLEPLMMIHAWAQMRKVTENAIDDYWLKKVSGCYRIKEPA